MLTSEASSTSSYQSALVNMEAEIKINMASELFLSVEASEGAAQKRCKEELLLTREKVKGPRRGLDEEGSWNQALG